ncbi:MAG: hypothetical protein CVV64_20515 [Candidatus Wallbacteria bacterium HGW-Wallbacteria-1]|jgi:membrane carboxypeptidase/penicillin-binding protein|uniref:Glycosyl transferase family 51 domain-containing protein n=1 Tax=Candidatus Wallbacteria bacterium HGW-Wallbacteria-1 TaxID=2013854 RepID=A0A2N1PI69_9BACT|nr:MAG: hypothetical protein CVV64_20515 [Candidatus Wallbacteria bacterium HGW-Wallbacteria-1]
MKRILIFLIFLISITFLYYTIEIVAAKKDIPELLNKYRSKDIIKFDISNLSKRQIDILLKVQDPGFYNHKGVDFQTPGNGLTTISQSIVKKMFFENFKPGIQKIKQTLIAKFVVHPLISKTEQLNIFINTCWFEKDCVGIGSAARYYYNKNISDLTDDEYISIIAMISSPVAFNILKRPESNKERVRRIKLLMEGKYKPKGLMDQFYGCLSEDEQKSVAPASYFEKFYNEN